MTHAVYIAASDAATKKAAIAVGMTELLSRRVGRVGVFRPVVRAGRPDHLVETLRSRFRLAHTATGVTYEDVHADARRATADIVARYRGLADQVDAVVIVGTDYTDVGAPTEFGFNAKLAAHLGAPLLLVVNGRGRTPAENGVAVELALTEIKAEHATELATVVTRVDAADVPAVARPEQLLFALPEVPRLSAPTVRDLMEACDGQLLLGEERLLGREVGAILVGAMSLPNILTRLTEGAVIIIPSDRAAGLLPGLLGAHTAPTFPALSGIVMSGGMELPEPVAQLLDGMSARLPVVITEEDTFETAIDLSKVEGRFTPEADGKVETALGLFDEYVDGDALLDRLQVSKTAVTPLMFEYDLLERARAARRHIVLPEGEDERILRAADLLLRRGVAELTLLGNAAEIERRAAMLGLDVSGAHVVSPFDPALRERFAEEYARVRAHKGVNLDLARDTVTDLSYFGTLMVQLGLADGMVSGAAHTTAHTIRPAFEIIKTEPGTELVSSVFFMCLPDRVLVYGDCAINPEPGAEQLAAIAISAAATAARFGVEPRVAMLSYSTGDSGHGGDVDKVRAATALVRERRPDLLIEGPIQYDAAIDPGVAQTKLPGNPVAGRATVFIVPDLNTGNNLYKAVQRSAGAVAVGPVLQGLRKPVNDLSRGATVQDIVNTVAITAIQGELP
ncbi:phosphate acetyltransferase [Actinomadura rudentiformis]|uniref:Phosphate acetyltransferase n=1 Tax=Actinomadura rudentiformis TaxID=359158 RepID=A0A6H9Z6K8_9ACTN|nr:phosphate acetyltransferase [Actinomadura rudentiformis]KAB2349465.1 phosphate acetyltransferase [Actinomadura rudentiformis]